MNHVLPQLIAFRERDDLRFNTSATATPFDMLDTLEKIRKSAPVVQSYAPARIVSARQARRVYGKPQVK